MAEPVVSDSGVQYAKQIWRRQYSQQRGSVSDTKGNVSRPTRMTYSKQAFENRIHGRYVRASIHSGAVNIQRQHGGVSVHNKHGSDSGLGIHWVSVSIHDRDH